MDDFLELNAMRGLSARQRRLLELQALYEDTHYDHLEDWGARDLNGEPLPVRARKPAVLLGLASEKVNDLVRDLTGADAGPNIEGIEGIREAVNDLRLEHNLSLAVTDLVVKGACCVGVARLPEGMWEPVILAPEWCEPVFAAQAGSERAANLAAEFAALGVALPAPRRRDHLWVPPQARSDDLVCLRHEWVVDEEVAARHGGQPRETVRWRYRRDYLPHVILEYRPLRVTGTNLRAPRWELAEAPRPHQWGVVPLVWERAPGARPGDVDGPSLLSAPVRSLARQADVLESLAGDSVAKIAWPQLATVDLQDRVDEASEFAGGAPMPASSAYVLEFRSTTQTQGQVKILEVSGEGVKLAADMVQRAKRRIEDLTGLVDFDQDVGGGALSGTALERVMRPWIATVRAWRVPLERLVVKLCAKLGAIEGVAVKPQVAWPRIIETTPQDLVAAAGALVQATGGAPVMSQETAIRVLGRIAALPDVEQEVATVMGRHGETLEGMREELARREEEAAGVKKAVTGDVDEAGHARGADGAR